MTIAPGSPPSTLQCARVSTGEAIFPTQHKVQSKGGCGRSPICSFTSCDVRGRDSVKDQDGYEDHGGSQGNEGGDSQTDGQIFGRRTLHREGWMDACNNGELRRRHVHVCMWLTQHPLQIDTRYLWYSSINSYLVQRCDQCGDYPRL